MGLNEDAMIVSNIGFMELKSNIMISKHEKRDISFRDYHNCRS